MPKQNLETVFTQEVHNKYLVFNTLFSRLPYDKMAKIGSILPFLTDIANQGFEEGKYPKEVIDEFFDKFTVIKSEQEKIDLLFRLITYIERQVVLFDSVEDAAFSKLTPEDSPGTLKSILTLAKQYDKLEEVREKLRNFKTRVVFTAHPTQFYPNSVLRIIQDLEQFIEVNDINAIDQLLQQLGKTPFFNDEQPTPVQEAQSIIFFLRHVYYEVLSQIQETVTKEIFEGEEIAPVMELGFWPGGDRDGNPFVTAEITKQVAQELRSNILKCYYNNFKSIRRRFTFKGVIPLLDKINNKLYTNMFGLNNDLTYNALLSRLEEVREVMVSRHGSIFIDELDRFILRVKLFGMHFATLDIRQDSSIHEKVMQAVNEKFKVSEKPYAEWSHEEKVEFLTTSTIEVWEDDFSDPLVKDTFKTVKAIKEIQTQNGERACNRYIISNSTSACSVLEVLALFKFCGFRDAQISVDIIPLFETIEGLDTAKDTMEELYNNLAYRRHLNLRKNTQTIMLGFSDGTKDGGYIKANWEIFDAKERLTAVSKENDVSVIFFDGRGGPPARGGGKTHQFYASQGPTIANNQIQVTIQGQTISSMYGSRPQAKFNFEQLLSAGVLNDVFRDQKSIISEKERTLIEELAEIGGQKYLELKNHPLFVSYLENKSPLKYYGQTKIGSRPSKRSSGGKLKLSELRAIPFVGAWSQLKQNIPGFYGLGTAIQTLQEEGRLNEVVELYNNSLFFKTLIQNSMMAMSKTYFPLTSYMKEDPVYGEFWNIMHEEFQKSVKLMLEISNQTTLMETEVVGSLSVNYREQIVLPLLAIQQYALQMIEETEDEELKLVYQKMVTRSLFGNINASRNSA
jgi:phosphoenolpyruvate carboxylase